MMANPRRRRVRRIRRSRSSLNMPVVITRPIRRRRRHYPIAMRQRSISRRSRGLLGQAGVSGSIVNTALPLSAGFIAGLVIPKMFTSIANNKTLDIAVTVGAGLFSPMLLSKVVSKKTAYTIASGILASGIVKLVDNFLLGKTTVGNVLKDEDTVDVIDYGDVDDDEEEQIVNDENEQIVDDDEEDY